MTIIHNSIVEWNSEEDVRAAAIYVQRKLEQRLETGLREVFPRFRLVQLGHLPSQQDIICGLLEGRYIEELE